MAMEIKPLVVTFAGLLRMGWPYSRANTYRMMAAEIPDPEHKPVGVEEQRMIPNPDPFPVARKLKPHRSSHPLWVVSQVLDYFEKHGLPVSEDWHNSQ